MATCNGKAVVDSGEYLQKIKAAVRARGEADTFVIARTDALALEGVDAALMRANAALDCGADVAFVEAPTTMREVERIAAELSGPKMYNLASGGRSPQLSLAELADLGFELVVLPAVALYAALHGMMQAAREVLARGDDSPVAGWGLTVDDLYQNRRPRSLAGTRRRVRGAGWVRR